MPAKTYSQRPAPTLPCCRPLSLSFLLQAHYAPKSRTTWTNNPAFTRLPALTHASPLPTGAPALVALQSVKAWRSSVPRRLQAPTTSRDMLLWEVRAPVHVVRSLPLPGVIRTCMLFPRRALPPPPHHHHHCCRPRHFHIDVQPRLPPSTPTRHSTTWQTQRTTARCSAGGGLHYPWRGVTPAAHHGEQEHIFSP